MRKSGFIRLSVGVIGAFFAISMGVFMIAQNSGQKRVLNVAIIGQWKSLHPGLQHTLHAGLVLSNQFDSLVGVNDSGVISPLGAKSWEIADDFRSITFQIDTDRHFSDGSYLTASDYKRSWENAMTLDPKSANPSLLDLVYSLEGYDQFQKTGVLSGVEAVGEAILKIRFNKPFRMALPYLTGTRFSAFKEKDGKYIGTGKYIISEISEDVLNLEPNPFGATADQLQPVRLNYVHPSRLAEKFENKEIDVMFYGISTSISEDVLQNERLKIVPGHEAVHLIVVVNGKEDALLSKKQYRQALQYLILQGIVGVRDPLGSASVSRVDAQVYLPFQPGRLTDSEAAEQVSLGKQYVDDLRVASKKSPLTLLWGQNTHWLRTILENAGISLSEQSRVYDRTESTKLYYSGEGYDLLPGGISVIHGDPDGLFHALGKHGAILSPAAFRPEVARLLEMGRPIIGQEKLDAHYRLVSKAILDEVPFIHIGFSKTLAIYRPDVVDIQNLALRRNEGHLDIFKKR